MSGIVDKTIIADAGGTVLDITAANAAKVDGSAVTQPVSAVSLPLPTGAATETTLGTKLSESDFDTKIGSLTETAPGTDTASSGLNGRLQRIAQRITSLITALGSPFQAGGSIGNTSFGSTVADGANVVEGAVADAAVVTDTTGTLSGKLRGLIKWAFERMPGSLGQKTMANSFPVVISSDQSAIPISGSVTANAGTNLNTSALALSATQTDGTQKAIARGGAKGSTTAADITSTSQSADRNAMDVQIRTSSGVVVDTFGGGTQYTEDAVAAADPVGTAPILVRKDTPSATVSTDGDNIAQRGTNYGAAYVQVVNSAGAYVDTFGGGTQYTEDAILPADPVGNQLMARRQDTLSQRQVSANGDAIALNATDQGALLVAMTDMTLMFKRALQAMERPPYMSGVGRVRIDYTDAQALAAMSVTVSGAISSVTTVSTVSTITGLTGLGTGLVDQTFTYFTQNRDVFNQFKNNIIN